MDLKKIDLKILKLIIFEVANNDGATFDNIAKKNKIDPEIFKEHILFLENLGLLESQNIVIKLSAGEELLPLKFKQHVETLQKIASILDNNELSQLLNTQFYKDNVNDYLKNLIKSMEEQALYPLPDAEYMQYALTNSPSSVRYFLVDNDMNTFKSFYQRCISSTNEKMQDRKKLELMDKCHMYLIWENVIFGKIQDDKHNNILVENVPYFTGYLPIAKKSFDKLLELYRMVEKEPPEKKSKFKKYLSSMVSSKLSIFGFF
ncbi:MAG: hypothetical protein Q8M95_10755 [Candidatus Methanoperedens sp.]|nr:hypothetical protein [Candidatus Methanoperedens sp.]